jgi:hypothetical protein
MSEDKAKKIDGRSRSWAFTLNNPTEADYVRFEHLNEREEDVKWYVVGVEKGENGTTHFQGSLSFKHGKSWRATFRWLRGQKKIEGKDEYEWIKPDGMELKPCRASEWTNAAYCQKGNQSKEEWEADVRS